MWFQAGTPFSGGASFGDYFSPGASLPSSTVSTVPGTYGGGIVNTIQSIINAAKGLPSPGTIPGSVVAPPTTSGLGWLLVLAIVVILIVALKPGR